MVTGASIGFEQFAEVTSTRVDERIHIIDQRFVE
jgi:hypothetical protein